MRGWLRSVASSIVFCTLCSSWAPPSWAGSSSTRSAAAVSAFKRGNPCPATGQRRGGCPGYVVDHVRPLCAGGPDHPANMQWQTLPDSLQKDAQERHECRQMRQATH